MVSLILNLLNSLLTKNDTMIAFAIVMPGFANALKKKANGKLFPLDFIIYCKRKHSKEIVFYLIGVHPDYQSKGSNSSNL